MKREAPPIVLVFGGSDPTGGAGIQADIETLISMGCHPTTVVTAVTAQDTTGVKQFTPVEPALIVAQARAVLEDMSIAAFKVGMLGNSINLSAVASVVSDYPDIPLIVDPILSAGGGGALSEDALEEALRTVLLPQASLVTPNSLEARRLAPNADTLDACAQELLATGCEYVLITGTHEASTHVVNRLYGNRRLLETFTWDRLADTYHGSGCTLAAACAAAMAHGFDIVNAVNEAQEFTWNALAHGYRAGMGQLIPNRLYWVHDDVDDEA